MVVNYIPVGSGLLRMLQMIARVLEQSCNAS